MGIQSPVGKRFSYHGGRESENSDGVVIGVIKDFHQSSLHNKIEPLVLKLTKNWFYVTARINPENVSESIEFLENKWKEFVPYFPFEYGFLDEKINANYHTEQRTGTIFKYFTFLALFISCLGLFGLATFMGEQRTKEIGIRKVLGASVSGILLLLSREFTKCVLIANIIAWPAAYFIINKWLENFAYRMNLGIWIFMLSGILVLVIAIFTISYQAIKAAITNPVESLRYE